MILNLKNNLIADVGMKQLCRAMVHNRSLFSLNVSKNLITDESAESIQYMLENNFTLRELYLGWNKITHYGGVPILDGIIENKKLTVLDFSYNLLGQRKQYEEQRIVIPQLKKINQDEFINKFCEIIPNYKTLMHLDLSSNHFLFEECQQIAEALKQNQTMYGFHFEGNYGVTDKKMFLVCSDDKDEQFFGQLCLQQQIDSVNCLRNNKSSKFEKNRNQTNCWICEGWSECTFTWTPDQSGSTIIDQQNCPLFIHFEHENWKPILLSPTRYYIEQIVKSYPQDEKNDLPPRIIKRKIPKIWYQIKRMIPPGTVRYFYSTPKKMLLAIDQAFFVQKTKRGILNKIKLFNYGPIKRIAILSKYHQIENQVNKKLVNNETYQVSVETKPRIQDQVWAKAIEKDSRIPWGIHISVFKGYKFDNEVQFKKCFQLDWSLCRIDKFVKAKQDRKDIQNLLKQNYSYIKNAYKHFSAYGSSTYYCCSSNHVSEYYFQMKFCDDLFQLSQLDLQYIATYSGKSPKERKKINPEKSLVRFEFMECLVRCAKDKYLRSKQTQTVTEAMKIMIDEYIIPHAKQYVTDFHVWRDSIYWREEVDSLYKIYLHLLLFVFYKYSGRDLQTASDINFMSRQELSLLTKDVGLFNTLCTEREVRYAFLFSKESAVNEYDKESTTIQMFFQEFLEAFARLADKSSQPPFTNEEELEQWEENPQNCPYTLTQRKKLPLYIKLETAIRMCLKLVPEHYRKYLIEQFPEKSIFNQFYIIKDSVFQEYPELLDRTKKSWRIRREIRYKMLHQKRGDPSTYKASLLKRIGYVKEENNDK